MKILIADDDTTSRHMLEMLMDAWGYDVEAVDNGEDAVAALLRPDGPSLALLDWMMPHMDGLETCQRLRQETQGKPLYLILVTSRADKKDVATALRAGADEYVTKPYDSGELLARIEVGRRMVELQETLNQRVAELKDALEEVKTLQGLLPICMHCHKIRDESSMWHRLETYVQDRTHAVFSHGLCPHCLDKYYLDGDRDKEEQEKQEDLSGEFVLRAVG